MCVPRAAYQAPCPHWRARSLTSTPSPPSTPSTQDERSRCERDLLGSDLSAWRRSNLEAQAEALSNDIYALERLLRISDAAPTIEGWS